MYCTVMCMLTFLFVSSAEGRISDVTTVYQVGEVVANGGIKRVVHARTNALGLRLSDGHTEFDSLPAHQYNITFDSLSLYSWDWNVSNEENAIINEAPITEYTVYPVNNLLGITVTGVSDQDVLFMFTTTESLLRNSNFYYRLKLWSNGIDMLKCTPSLKGGYGHYDRDRGYFNPTCDSTTSFSVPSDFTYLWIKFGSKIQIWQGKHMNEKIYEWINIDYHNDRPIKYFSMYQDTTRHDLHAAVVNKRGGLPMTSPFFTPLSNDLCLVVLFSCTNSSSTENLQLLIESHTPQFRHLLQTIYPSKSGMNYKTVNLTLPNEIEGPFRIVITSSTPEKITIIRVTTCNPEGADVTMLESLPAEEIENIRKKPAFDAIYNAYYDETISNFTGVCENGGQPYYDGCACPAGFMGSTCAKGCGRNHFGQDCGGVCSFHRRECEGLLLCTPKVGCHCAPGYKGNYCDIQCKEFEYGADCNEKCGHCEFGGSCDRYTGECSTCELGYVSPMCKQVYSYPALPPLLSSPDYDKVNVTFTPSNVKGYGSPYIYQVQYREEGNNWRTYTNKLLPDSVNLALDSGSQVTETIDGLTHGVFYDVRVLFMDDNFNKYSGELVPVSQVLIKCDIPEISTYEMSTEHNATSTTFHWMVLNASEHACPVKSYEVVWKDAWEWQSVNVTGQRFTLSNLVQGAQVELKMRALTTNGYTPFSKPIRGITTQSSNPVQLLKFQKIGNTAVKVLWQPPPDMENRTLEYVLTYKCVEQPACLPGCQNSSEVTLYSKETSVTLSSLLPFARYMVTVAPRDGPEAKLYLGTPGVVPTERPLPSAQTPLRTNTSLTVFWDQPQVCSSFLMGYQYSLVKHTENEVLTGFTDKTNLSFYNLTANSEYTLKVYVETVLGTNPNVFLTINTSTSATVPNVVRELTVYKVGRTAIGLRWTAPQAPYGHLKSFTVSHVNMVTTEKISEETIQPTHCIPWPELYCHTIDQLKPNRRYNITVSARNTEVDQDGEKTSIIGVTKESSPTEVIDLKNINVTSRAVVLQWHHPDLANGVIRSFVISVEEMERFDQDSCCQDYPLVELPVTEEKQFYSAEVTGLLPASTYSLGVTAKTVVLGPSQSLVMCTQPPHLPLTTLPKVTLASSKLPLSWQPQEDLTESNITDVYAGLVKSHVLLVVVPADVHLPKEIYSPDVQFLQTIINQQLYFVKYYKEGDEVLISEIQLFNQPPPTGQTYQLVAAQVTEYCGLYNADVIYSDTFTFSSATTTGWD